MEILPMIAVCDKISGSEDVKAMTLIQYLDISLEH